MSALGLIAMLAALASAAASTARAAKTSESERKQQKAITQKEDVAKREKERQARLARRQALARTIGGEVPGYYKSMPDRVGYEPEDTTGLDIAGGVSKGIGQLASFDWESLFPQGT